MRLVGKILIGLLVFVLVVGVALAGWFTWMVRRSYPQTTGTLDVAGLSAPVTVVRDAHGIPNIYADTTEDLFFAQGYVHAQDRFWQMDFNRHVTGGRISELVGESQLDTDKYLRTMGWRRVAEQEWALATGESRTVLQAYADGVNAYIGDRSPTELGLEYLLPAHDRWRGRGRAVDARWTPSPGPRPSRGTSAATPRTRSTGSGTRRPWAARAPSSSTRASPSTSTPSSSPRGRSSTASSTSRRRLPRASPVRAARAAPVPTRARSTGSRPRRRPCSGWAPGWRRGWA